MKLFKMTLLCAAMVVSANPACALVVTVGGRQYDVQHFDAAWDTINAANSDILKNTETAPWWGDASLAQTFGLAYLTAVTAGSGVYPFDSYGAVEVLNFGYSEDAVTVGQTDAYRLTETGATSFATVGSTAGNAYINWATATALPTPEINANALAKALFGLFALGTWLIAGRGPSAQV